MHLLRRFLDSDADGMAFSSASWGYNWHFDVFLFCDADRLPSLSATIFVLYTSNLYKHNMLKNSILLDLRAASRRNLKCVSD